jgi:hypothetical protein
VSKLKSLIIDVTEEYGRGTSVFKIADMYDLCVDEVQDIILKYYDSELAMA